MTEFLDLPNPRFQKYMDVLSRYCRFFVDDLQMREKYRSVIRSAESELDNFKWALDSAKLEYDFGCETTSIKMIRKLAKRKLGNSIAAVSTFTAIYDLLNVPLTQEPPKKAGFQRNDTVSQNFALPKPLISYICGSGNYEVTQKLQYASKQTYLLTKKTLCFNVSITDLDENEAFEESLFVSTENPNINQINNIFIFNTLFVLHDEPDTLSSVIPKITRCTLRHLILCGQVLTLKEYNFLTASKTIELLWLHFSTVIDVDYVSAEVKDEIRQLPKIVK